jgi:hypothetical protein
MTYVFNKVSAGVVEKVHLALCPKIVGSVWKLVYQNVTNSHIHQHPSHLRDILNHLSHILEIIP